MKQPCERHFCKCLTSAPGYPVQFLYVIQFFSRNLIFMQEPAVGAYPAVSGNTVEVSVCKHTLCKRREAYNTFSETV